MRRVPWHFVAVRCPYPSFTPHRRPAEERPAWESSWDALFGFLAWFVVRYVLAGIYTVDQNERAVMTTFGRAERLGGTTLDDPIAESLARKRRSATPIRKCGSCTGRLF